MHLPMKTQWIRRGSALPKMPISSPSTLRNKYTRGNKTERTQAKEAMTKEEAPTATLEEMSLTMMRTDMNRTSAMKKTKKTSQRMASRPQPCP